MSVCVFVFISVLCTDLFVGVYVEAKESPKFGSVDYAQYHVKHLKVIIHWLEIFFV